MGFFQFLLNFVEYVINSVTNVHQLLIVDCDSKVCENFKYFLFKLSKLDFSFGDQLLDFFTDNTLGNIQSIQNLVNGFQQSLSQLFLDSINNFTISICQSSFMSEFIEEFEHFLFQFIDFYFSFDNQIFHFLSQFDVDNIKSVQNLISSFQDGFFQFFLNFVEYVINSITNVHQFLIVDCDSEVCENFKYFLFKLSKLDFSFGDQFLDLFTDPM